MNADPSGALGAPTPEANARPERRQELRLAVWRRIDNYYRGLPDDSPLAVDLHLRRGRALRSALGSAVGISVTDWGATRGPRADLAVSLRLRLVGGRAPLPATPALRSVAQALRGDGVPAAVAETTAALIQRLRPLQRNRSILDHEIALPGGRTLWCDPDGDHLLITLTLADGRRRHIHWREPPAAGTDHGTGLTAINL